MCELISDSVRACISADYLQCIFIDTGLVFRDEFHLLA